MTKPTDEKYYNSTMVEKYVREILAESLRRIAANIPDHPDIYSAIKTEADCLDLGVNIKFTPVILGEPRELWLVKTSTDWTEYPSKQLYCDLEQIHVREVIE